MNYSEQAPAFLSTSSIWTSTGLPEDYLERLKFSKNPEEEANSSFRIVEAAQAAIGLSGLSAAYFHELRAGVEQNVNVDARHAILGFNSHAYYTIDGKPPGPQWDTIAGIYETKDHGHVRLHTNFPHHRKGVLEILGLEDTAEVSRKQVQDALLNWNALDFEDIAAEKGMCAFAMRTFEEWDATPQARALRETPPVSIRKIAEAPKRKVDCSDYRYALEGIKVLDLSRVLAGPVAGRTLAAHGADVLLVTSENLPALPKLDPDTSRGKRTTRLDLNSEEGVETLRTLAGDADVFLQAYRPGALGKKGFGVQDLASMTGNREHGLVCANLCAWGWEGPWKDRRGFDSLVQTAMGFNLAEAEAHGQTTPKSLPVQALDFAAGYLLAFGITAALCKTITEGGSWEVRVSLAAVGQWLRSLGRATIGRPLPTDPFADEIHKLSVACRAGREKESEMIALKHPAVLEKTPVREGEDVHAAVVLDANQPVWAGTGVCNIGM